METTWNVRLCAFNASFEEKLNIDDDYISLRKKIFFFGNKITK